MKLKIQISNILVNTACNVCFSHRAAIVCLEMQSCQFTDAKLNSVAKIPKLILQKKKVKEKFVMLQLSSVAWFHIFEPDV